MNRNPKMHPFTSPLTDLTTNRRCSEDAPAVQPSFRPRSLLYALSYLAAFFFIIAALSSVPVQAAPTEEISNVELDPDTNIMTWDAFSGAACYEVAADDIAEDIKGTSLNINTFLASYGFKTGRYKIYLTAMSETGNKISVTSADVTASYTAKGVLSTASGLKWDGNAATFKSVAHAEGYTVNVYSYANGRVSPAVVGQIGFSAQSGSRQSIDFSDMDTLITGTDYVFTVQAFNHSGYANSNESRHSPARTFPKRFNSVTLKLLEKPIAGVKAVDGVAPEALFSIKSTAHFTIKEAYWYVSSKFNSDGSGVAPSSIEAGGQYYAQVVLKAMDGYCFTSNTKVNLSGIKLDWKQIEAGGTELRVSTWSTFSKKGQIKKADITGIEDKTWTGKKIKQSPVVRYNGTKLKRGRDYYLTYKKNKNVGTATVTITGEGNYTGSVKKTFQILPKNTAVKKLTGGAKSVTVTWKKLTDEMSKEHITGYQIQYSISSKFTSSTSEKVKVKGYKKTAKQITGLTSGKKYYVRIRTFLKTGGKTYYSEWSKSKSVKAK